jgi:predicted permease
VEQASADVAAIAASIAAENPETNDGVIADVRPFTHAFMDDETRRTLYAMLATVVMVLFIACANVANLLLARAAVRSRDVAIRTALGASRARVIVQMMAEATALALAGAVLGTGFAWIGIRLFDRAVAPSDPPFWFSFALDAPILAFVAGVSLLAALVSGAIPAWRASSTDVNAVLKDESRGSSSLHIGKLSRALVVAEVAMSVALLVASGLMIQSVVRLDRMDLPFPTNDVFTARIAVFEERFPDVRARQTFWEDVEQRVASVAGVTSVGLTNELPGLGGGEATFAEDGASYTSETDLPSSRMILASPGYFPTFDLTPIHGRLFTRLDGADATPVAIVNESFVRQRFADGQAVGRRIRVGGLDSDEPWREVVGVVRDAGMEGPNDPDAGAPDGFYVPLAQGDANFISVAARTGGSPLAITELVRNEVATADPDTPIYFVDTLGARIEEDLWFYSVFGTLFAVFGAAALFMASVGLYGVMSFTVSRRIQEMGIRMALGAEAAQVRGLVLRQGMVQIGLGMLLGTGLAILVARGLQIFILGAKPWDPATYALVFAVLTLTGLAASAVPARRATRVDPMVALRSS